MKKLLIPAMGVAAAFGAAQPAAADVQLSQFFLPGQPGVTGSVNRTVPPGNPGISPLNAPTTPSPFSVAPSPSFTQPSPFIGQRGDLNSAERETAMPGEPDKAGKIGPTVDRQRARFAGERGADGKLLPTYSTEQAQATTPSQATPPTPAPSDMPRNQPSTTNTMPGSSSQPGSTTRRPGSGAMSTPAPQGQNQMGTMGNSPQPTTRSGTTSQSDTSMQQRQPRAHTQPRGDKSMSGSTRTTRGQNEMSETAALNALSAEGYTNVGKIERIGGNWQTTATKDGRQVTVQVDPQTNRITPR